MSDIARLLRSLTLVLVALLPAVPLEAQPVVRGADPAEIELVPGTRGTTVTLRGRGLSAVTSVAVVEPRRMTVQRGVEVDIRRRSRGALQLVLTAQRGWKVRSGSRFGLAIEYPNPRDRRRTSRTLVRGVSVIAADARQTRTRTSRTSRGSGRVEPDPVPVITSVESDSRGYVLVGQDFGDATPDVHRDGQAVPSGLVSVEAPGRLRVDAPCLAGGSYQHRVGSGEAFSADHPGPEPFQVGAPSWSRVGSSTQLSVALSPNPPAACRDALQARLVEVDAELTQLESNGLASRWQVPGGVDGGSYTLEVSLHDHSATASSPALVPGAGAVTGLDLVGGGGSQPWPMPLDGGPELRVSFQGAGLDEVEISIQGRIRRAQVGPGDTEAVLAFPPNVPPGGPYDVNVNLRTAGTPVTIASFSDAVRVVGRPTLTACGTPDISPTPGELSSTVLPGEIFIVEGEHLMDEVTGPATATVRFGDAEGEVRPSSTAARLEVTVPEDIQSTGGVYVVVDNGWEENYTHTGSGAYMCFVQRAQPYLSGFEPEAFTVAPNAQSITLEAYGSWLGVMTTEAWIGDVQALTVEPLERDRVRLRFPADATQDRLRVETTGGTFESQQPVFIQQQHTPEIDGLVSSVVTEGDPIRVAGQDLLPRDNTYLVELRNVSGSSYKGSLIHEASTAEELHFERGTLVNGDVRLVYFNQNGTATGRDAGSVTFVGPPEILQTVWLAEAGTEANGQENRVRGLFFVLPDGEVPTATVGGAPATVSDVETVTSFGSSSDWMTLTPPAEESMTIDRQRDSWKVEVVLTTPYGSATAEAHYRRAPFIERVHEAYLQDGALRLGEAAVVCGTFFESQASNVDVRLAGAPQQVEQMTASATERCLRFRVDEAAQGGLLEIENRWGSTEVGDFDVVEDAG